MVVNKWKVTAIIFIILFLCLAGSLILEGAKDYTKQTDCYNYGQDNVKSCAIYCSQYNYSNSYLVGDSGKLPECKCYG